MFFSLYVRMTVHLSVIKSTSNWMQIMCVHIVSKRCSIKTKLVLKYCYLNYFIHILKPSAVIKLKLLLYVNKTLKQIDLQSKKT